VISLQFIANGLTPGVVISKQYFKTDLKTSRTAKGFDSVNFCLETPIEPLPSVGPHWDNERLGSSVGAPASWSASALWRFDGARSLDDGRILVDNLTTLEGKAVEDYRRPRRSAKHPVMPSAHHSGAGSKSSGAAILFF